MMIGLFVVGGAIMQTGLAKLTGNKLMALSRGNETITFLLVMLVTSFIGAFVSNTGTVALMMPIIMSIAAGSGMQSSRFLMPLAFAGSLGGMLTLIGTPPNLVIDEVLTEAGFKPLAFFSFFPVGIIVIAIGIIVLMPLSKIFLSRKQSGKKKKTKSLDDLVDLAFRYMEPDIYYDLVEQVKIKRREREDMINEAMTTLKDAVEKAGIRCEIQGRPKNFYSIHKKMLRDHKQLSEIYDLLAIRVLVDTVKDCYGTLGIVHSMWRPIPGRFKDYVAVPKSNMYQSLHTTVLSNGGQPLEIQIRTFEMHRISEYGIAAHWRYKESGGSKPAAGGDKGFDAKLSWLRQLLEWHKDMNDSRDFVNTVKMDIFADEVFVFTPRGDVIDLPVGSVPIDFAYRIHTDVGNRCVGAKVNGRIVPLDYQLKNGDIVEVITSKQSNGPSRDWINVVGSSDTRNKIKSWFKKERREENIVKGREMLEREVKRLGYEPKVLMSPEKLKEAGSKIRIDTDENLLATLGYGGVTLNTVMSKLVEIYKKEQKLETAKDLAQVLAELKPRKSKAKASHGILVKGEEGIMVKLARCCNPIPGDPVIGYITRGSGISVHRADCPNILTNNPEEQRRLIEVAWDVGIDDVYKVNIVITSVDRTGLMSDIMNVTSETKINIFSLACHTDKNKIATMHMGLDIMSLEQLEYFMNRIRRMKGVYSVERLISTANGSGGKKK